MTFICSSENFFQQKISYAPLFRNPRYANVISTGRPTYSKDLATRCSRRDFPSFRRRTATDQFRSTSSEDSTLIPSNRMSKTETNSPKKIDGTSGRVSATHWTCRCRGKFYADTSDCHGSRTGSCSWR